MLRIYLLEDEWSGLDPLIYTSHHSSQNLFGFVPSTLNCLKVTSFKHPARIYALQLQISEIVSVGPPVTLPNTQPKATESDRWTPPKTH